MHEGCYSDQSWSTYECPADDLDAFLLLSERFSDGSIEGVFPTFADAFFMSNFDSKTNERFSPSRRELLGGGPISESIGREFGAIIKSAAAKPLSVREYDLAKRAFVERCKKPYFFRFQRSDYCAFFGIQEES